MSERDYFTGLDSEDAERVLTFIESMDRGLPPFLAQMEAAALEENVPVIRTQTQSLIRFFLAAARPERILEVGTATGFSALFMNHYAPQAKITTIEKDPERAKAARQAFEGNSSILLIEGDASEALHKLAQEREQFDFILMDAAKGQYIHYLADVMEILAPRGIMISDDIFMEGEILQSRFSVKRRDRTIHKRMREYIEALTGDPRLETILLQEGDGTAVSLRI